MESKWFRDHAWTAAASATATHDDKGVHGLHAASSSWEAAAAEDGQCR
ncbi:MAG TPA: hypothetical protein VGR78_11280 [Verrucomicrobiae bacterium]|nr:hypothetical protein [Verrucomicrobiae bacterium]